MEGEGAGGAFRLAVRLSLGRVGGPCLEKQASKVRKIRKRLAKAKSGEDSGESQRRTEGGPGRQESRR